MCLLGLICFPSSGYLLLQGFSLRFSDGILSLNSRFWPLPRAFSTSAAWCSWRDCRRAEHFSKSIPWLKPLAAWPRAFPKTCPPGQKYETWVPSLKLASPVTWPPVTWLCQLRGKGSALCAKVTTRLLKLSPEWGGDMGSCRFETSAFTQASVSVLQD